jgi:hypothetical protein
LRRALLAASLYAAVAAAIPAVARAQVPVSAVDLFLAPSRIPTALYDTHYLTFGAASDVFQGYSSTDVGGTLLGVHILPVLRPNPSPASDRGAYTDADLAAIDATNFDTYFLRRPTIDYAATFTPSFVNIDYRASGQYFVEILAESGGTPFSRIFHDQVDDFFSEDPPKAPQDKAGVAREIPVPVADLYLVSTNDPAYDDHGALDNAEKIFKQEKKPVERVGSLDDVKKKIEDASKKAGKKIEVVLVGHGRGLPKGSIKIGTERVNDDTDSNMKPEDFQKLIDPFTHSIQFYSCETGQDQKFIDAMTASIKEVTTFKTLVTWASPSADGQVKGFIDTEARANATLDSVPEPSTLVFVLGGGAVLLLRRWRPRGRRSAA